MTSGLAGPLLTDMVIKRARNLLSPFYDLHILSAKKILLLVSSTERKSAVKDNRVEAVFTKQPDTGERINRVIRCFKGT